MTPIMIVVTLLACSREDSGLSGFVVVVKLLASVDVVCVVIGSPGVVVEVPEGGHVWAVFSASMIMCVCVREFSMFWRTLTQS